MDSQIRAKVNEQLANLSGNKPHRAYYQLKKKQGNGNWTTVAKVPASAAVDIEEEIWNCDDSWGGAGTYRLTLYETSEEGDKKVPGYESIPFVIGDGRVSDDYLSGFDYYGDRHGLYNWLKTDDDEDDDLTELNKDIKKRIKVVQNQKLLNELTGDGKDKDNKEIAKLKKDMERKEQQEKEERLFSKFDETIKSLKGGSESETVKLMLAMQQNAQNFQMQLERERMREKQPQMGIAEILELSEKISGGKKDTTPSFFEMYTVLQKERDEYSRELEKQKREDEQKRLEREEKMEMYRLEREEKIERERIERENKMERERMEMERQRREDEKNRPKATDFLAASAPIIAKMLERPEPQTTDWEKILASPVVAKMLDRKDENPINMAIPGILSTVTESITGIQGKVAEQLIANANRPYEDDEFTRRMKTIQSVTTTVMPQVNDLIERLAMIFAAKKGIHPQDIKKQPQQPAAQPAQQPGTGVAQQQQSEAAQIDANIKHLIVALEDNPPDMVLSYIENTQPELLDHYARPEFVPVIKQLNNEKLNLFWNLLMARKQRKQNG